MTFVGSRESRVYRDCERNPSRARIPQSARATCIKRVGIPFSTGDRVSADNTPDSPRSEEEAGVEEDLEDESPDMRPGSGLKRGFHDRPASGRK